ncbi:SMP-30/gluconolactonase/LRE family protein [Herbaspirillum sp. HC18]|nr:SMP-30/gluconolactonase/LRE family protein [Herbaspirillum sp. HC18]
MSASDIQVLFDIPMQLGECPLWHPQEEALYWIDIAGHAVHRFQPSTSEHRTWHLPSEPGCIAWSTGGGLIVAMRSGLAMLDTVSGDLVDLAKAPYDTARLRFNDGRCDAVGRLWVGTLYDPRDQQLGSLFCVEQGRIRDAGLPATVSNGVAFSTDSKTLYHTDTTAHRITVYDYDVTSGHVSNGRMFRQFSADKTRNYGGRPDGAAVDSENAYWCAMYEGGRILRISSDGDILREIQLPVRCPTMVAFGDPDFRTLFITTARRNRADEEIRQHPLSGCVLRLRVDVPGCAEAPYRP